MSEESRAEFGAVMHCPHCGRQHLDGRWWAHKPHITHTCRFCGDKWDSDTPLIGVRAEVLGAK